MHHLPRDGGRMVLAKGCEYCLLQHFLAGAATTVEVLYENRTCTVKDNRLADTFAPFAVHIYRWH